MQTETGERLERFLVEPALEGTRLDMAVAGRLDEVSRAQAKRWIEEGRVLVDGARARPSRPCRNGERVEVFFPPPTPATPLPEAIPLEVVFEDYHLIVVNKPPGMVVHPSAGHPSGTLVNALLAHSSELSGIGGVTRPGIVHRLDLGTSGLLVAAKQDRAHRHLGAQFARREVDKRYVALVHGDAPERMFFDRPLGRDPIHRKRISSRSTRARAAVTEAELSERLPSSSLLRVRITTGRTHQIRVHLSEAGHPLVGDREYGATKRGLQILRDFPRPALHAARLSFVHPETGERLDFEAPLPRDMVGLISSLRQCAS
ncbi:MAG TPA: RluA family pseudouridine synthase [Vicinamibacteria bacterium]|nr:RluA family pseudouridine synthase [Vicinamibacteria bacterium]